MNWEQMTDEELMNTPDVPSAPTEAPAPVVSAEEQPQTEPAVDEVPEAPEPSAASEPEQIEPEQAVPADSELGDAPASTPVAQDQQDKPNTETTSTEPEKKPDTVSPGSINYEEFYNKVVSTFKANGKNIELKSPEEAIQLMQMGANYTKKMQDIAVFKKHLTMLENNNLLDESELAFFIDLKKGDKTAIQKLLKETGVDPLDIDTNAPVAYQEGNHRVSDVEIQFRNTLEAVSATPTGGQTLQIINTTWDQASKEALWKDPGMMEVINNQRANGIYDRVVAEIERQTFLGNIKPGTPFLQAYQAVGTYLGNQGAFNDIIATAQQGQPAPAVQQPVAPIAVAPAVTTQPAANSAKAAAAAPTRTARRVPSVTNLAGLDDEAFLKAMEGRL